MELANCERGSDVATFLYTGHKIKTYGAKISSCMLKKGTMTRVNQFISSPISKEINTTAMIAHLFFPKFII